MHNVLALVLAGLMVSTAPAEAQHKSQLAISVENRLVSYGFVVDTSKLDNSTLAQLHLTMSSRDTEFEKRRSIRAILEKAGIGG